MISVTVFGMKDMGGKVTALIQSSSQIQKRVNDVLDKEAKEIVSLWQRDCPVASGEMRDDIRVISKQGYERTIGTTVKAAPLTGNSWTAQTFPQGYPYPFQQEFNVTYKHPRGGRVGAGRIALATRSPWIKSKIKHAVRQGLLGGRKEEAGGQQGDY